MDVMTARFVPANYTDQLLKRLHSLYQGNRSVEEYYQEMELLMLRADVDEDERHTMFRFLDGLKKEIKDQVEMCAYDDYHSLYQLALKVERRLASKPKNFSKPVEKPWQAKPWDRNATKGPSIGNKQATPSNPKTERTPIKVPDQKREVTCFKCNQKGHYANKCPNMRMAVLTDGHWVLMHESEEEELYRGKATEEPPARG